MSGVLLQQTDLSQLWLTTHKFMKRLTIQNSNKQQATKQGPTRNGQKYITPPTISFVWILFGLLHREPK